jgi:glycolate oxidase FAD binding subunit
MNSIVEHSPHDLTVTVESGVRIGALNAELARSGQRVPVDLPNGTAATMGGIVAANRTGGFARGFGSPRDLTLGLDAIDGRGRLLRCGGRVVKNVAGYDLTRLFVGSHGTLGIIARVTLRTAPLPIEACTLAVTLGDPAILERARTIKEIAELPLAALDFEVARGSWKLLARIEGDSSEVAYQSTRLTDVCESGVAETKPDWTSPIHASSHETFVASLGVPPACAVGIAAQLAVGLSALDASLRIAGRLHDGLVRVFSRSSPATDATRLVARLQDVAHRQRARLALERVSLETKTTLDVWGPSNETFHLMAGIKRTFDPDARLAPGRFIGRL